MISCVQNAGTSDDKLFYLLLGAGISFVSSFFVSWLIFYLNKLKEEERKKTETKEKLRNEIFAACDRLLRYSILTEHYALQYSLYDKLKKFGQSYAEITEFEQLSWKYGELAEESGSKHNLCKTDLIRTVYDLFIYWKEKSEVLIPLIDEAKKYGLRNFGDSFKNINTKDETIAEFQLISKSLEDVNVSQGIGVPLIKIQKEIAPEGMQVE